MSFGISQDVRYDVPACTDHAQCAPATNLHQAQITHVRKLYRATVKNLLDPLSVRRVASGQTVLVMKTMSSERRIFRRDICYVDSISTTNPAGILVLTRGRKK